MLFRKDLIPFYQKRFSKELMTKSAYSNTDKSADIR